MLHRRAAQLILAPRRQRRCRGKEDRMLHGSCHRDSVKWDLKHEALPEGATACNCTVHSRDPGAGVIRSCPYLFER